MLRCPVLVLWKAVCYLSCERLSWKAVRYLSCERLSREKLSATCPVRGCPVRSCPLPVLWEAVLREAVCYLSCERLSWKAVRYLSCERLSCEKLSATYPVRGCPVRSCPLPVLWEDVLWAVWYLSCEKLSTICHVKSCPLPVLWKAVRYLSSTRWREAVLMPIPVMSLCVWLGWLWVPVLCVCRVMPKICYTFWNCNPVLWSLIDVNKCIVLCSYQFDFLSLVLVLFSLN